MSVYFFNCAPDRSSPKSTYAQEFTVILCTTPFYLQTSAFYLEAFALDFRFSPWALAHGLKPMGFSPWS